MVKLKKKSRRMNVTVRFCRNPMGEEGGEGGGGDGE